MNSIATAGKEICDILGIRNCQTLSLTFRFGYVPKVTAVCIIKDTEKLNEIKKVIKRYQLKGPILPLP